MISTDAKILEEGSSVRARMVEYGALFKELHIVVCMKGRAADQRLAGNVFAYPTTSISKALYVADAVSRGTEIVAARHMMSRDSVITAQDPFETGLAGARLSNMTGIGLHIQIHTDIGSAYFGRGVLNRMRLMAARRTLPLARAVRVVSDRILPALSADVRSRALVLPIFSDVASARSIPVTENLLKKYPQFHKIALIASRLTKEKDIESALRAFASSPLDPNVGLVIVGSGPEEPRLRALADSLKVTARTVFEPWADHDTVVSYMKTCDAFVSTSLYEGYGLSMLEAHAVGTTLVATDAGIASLLAGEVCAPRDVRALASALTRALSDDPANKLKNKDYSYPYPSKQAYLEAYRKDVERALI